ncbi:hypothetical protein LSH36_332g02020 [Paralvinella palmiformis]|uniref:Uncharacterized protein n=1 Tax=Paralvinella palmiformis TaxID=53620 RepID=A0AAD9JGM9_9ANNE|nr:hypothetical protein LSH36_332g02020 [Paralvinella palmiformis]
MTQQNEREWNSGIFSCFDDMQTCLCGFFCPCCLTCRMAERMNEPCSCCIGFCLFPESVMALRLKLRSQHGIKGDICNDFICTGFCLSCTLCQLDREMKSMGI